MKGLQPREGVSSPLASHYRLPPCLLLDTATPAAPGRRKWLLLPSEGRTGPRKICCSEENKPQFWCGRGAVTRSDQHVLLALVPTPITGCSDCLTPHLSSPLRGRELSAPFCRGGTSTMPGMHSKEGAAPATRQPAMGSVSHWVKSGTTGGHSQ